MLLLDTGIGNIQSVANVLSFIGAPFEISATPESLERADKIVFPGVGTYGNAMEQIKKNGLQEPLRKALLIDRKLCLGICVGMQVMSELGTEFGSHPGLGVLPGVVKRIDVTGQKLNLPHIGWNDVQVKGEPKLFRNIPANASFYFIHSYHFVPSDRSIVSSTVQYGTEVVASVERDNLFGVQFHPEKSQEQGIRLLRNFVEL